MRLTPGYAINSFWGMKYAGVWGSEESYNRNKETKEYFSLPLTGNSDKFVPGLPKYVDINHDGRAGEEDYIYLGKADPAIYGGLENQFKIGSWDFSFLLTYAVGGKMFNYAELRMTANHNANQYAYMAHDGSPIVRSSFYNTLNSFCIHDASYLRLRDIEIRYNFAPKRNRPRFSIGITGENLFILTAYNGFDPLSYEHCTYNRFRIDKNPWPGARSIAFNFKVSI